MEVYEFLMSFLNTPERIEKRKCNHIYCKECLTGCNVLTYIGSQPERRQRETLVEHGDPECLGIYSQEDVIDGYEAILEAGYKGIEASDIKTWLDIPYWLKTNISLKGKDFSPYWYQDRCLKCTSRKKVLRMSRRAGKSEMLASYIIYRLFNAPRTHYSLLVICPAQAQAKEVWDKMLSMLESNPRLDETVKRTKTPYFEAIVKSTETRVRIFTAGSHSGNKALGVRGQGADELIMDEMDFLEEEDINTITPILTDPNQEGVKFIGATTLKGTETLFYKFCHTTNVKEFYVPFRARPDWTPLKEQDARDTCRTELAWDLEYNVLWTGKIDGVFQRSYVATAFDRKKFSYNTYNPNPKWQYFLGVDWNGNNNGTRIMVIGYNPGDNFIYTVDKRIVAYKDWTQTKAINEIVSLNRYWKPELIMIDNGFGQFQDEILRGIGIGTEIAIARGVNIEDLHEQDAKLKNIVETVDFGGNIEIPSLYTKKDETLNAKNFLVENLQRILEHSGIRMAQDKELRSQMLEYVVAKYSNRGRPVYKAGISGDHDLDALMLACFGFSKKNQQEFQEGAPVVAVAITAKSLDEINKAVEENTTTATSAEEAKWQKSGELPTHTVLPAISRDFFMKSINNNIGRSIGPAGPASFIKRRIFG